MLLTAYFSRFYHALGLAFVVGMILLCNGNARAQVSGRVYQDFNANGVFDTTRSIALASGAPLAVATDKGLSGIKVYAFNTLGTLVDSATTNATGAYTIPVSGAVRIVFKNFPIGYFSAPKGTNNGSAVQFVTTPATNVSLGLLRPIEYSEDNPLIATNCFAPYQHDVGPYATDPVLVTVPLSAGSHFYAGAYSSGCSSTADCPIGFNLPADNPLVRQNQIGTTFGLAWQRSRKTLYASAFVKQFTDLGPGGTGAIYKVDLTNPAAPVVTGYIDLNAIFGANTCGANPFIPYPDYNNAADRARVTNATYFSGLGDMDISEDEKTLYVVNLANKKIYSIPIDGSPINSTTIKVSPTVPVLTTYTPNPNFNVAFGLGVKGNDVYVTSNMSYQYDDSIGVFRYNPTANTFAPMPVMAYRGQFLLWFSVATDIAFAPDGAMMVAHRQSGSDRDGGSGGTPVFRACPNGDGTFTIENNASCGGVTTAGANTLAPGRGLYYYQTDPTDNNIFNNTGGLVQIPGYPFVLQSMYDPYRVYTAGISALRHSDGTCVKAYELVLTPPLNATNGVNWDAKQGVLGSIEVLSSAAPIEIGNRVWFDTNRDGKQDAYENGINGVTVQLVKNNAVIASTTTANGGQYYFNASNVTGGLLENTAYEIRIPTSQTILSHLVVTTTDVGSNLFDDFDNDGSQVGSNISKTFTTGGAGENNHTYDFGFQLSTANLKLEKTVNNSMPTQGANVVFSIKVVNIGLVNATGVTVHDTLPVGMTFISATPSGVFNNATKLWTIGNLAVGDSVTLLMTVRIDSTGVNYNTAEIHSMNEPDINSTPNNNVANEDDIARVCVTVPIPLCQGKTLTLRIASSYTNVKWYRNNVEIVGQTATSLVVSIAGDYSFTANELTCPITGCCPVKVYVVPTLTVTTQPQRFTECLGGVLSMSVATSGGLLPLTYQWQLSSDSLVWADIAGANTSVYTPPSTTSGTRYYRIRVADAAGGCDAVFSAGAAAIVKAQPTANIVANTAIICVGGVSTLVATSNGGGAGTCNFQWQSSPDGTNWTDITGAISANLTTTTLSASTKYRVFYRCNGNGCCL